MSSEWKVGHAYKVGDIINYNGKLYRCRTQHTSQSDWSPSIYTLSLWVETTTSTAPSKSPPVANPPPPVANPTPVAKPSTTVTNPPPVANPPPPVANPTPVAKPSTTVNTGGPLLAPYIYSWGFWNSSYKIRTCMDLSNKCGGTAITFAFVLAGTGNQIAQDIYDFSDDIKAFNAVGGKLIVSFGGANGTYCEQQLSESDMVSEVSKLIDSTKCYGLDFDVEGSILADSALNDKRAKIIAQLQSKYPKLYISFTLPADRDALTDIGIALISNAIKNGININTVNLMIMDLGSLNGQTFSAVTIDVCTKVIVQLKELYPNKSESELYKMIGITNMIGNDDQGSIFTVEDAKIVGAYAKQKNIGLVSFWAINRDQVGSNDLGLYSEQNKVDFEYFNAFKAALNN